MEGEDEEEDAAKGSVVGVELFVGEARKEGDRGVGGFEGEEVVQWELGGGDDTEAFG